MHRSGIISGGNWIVDHVKLIDNWPPQDALVSILSQSDGNGGSAYNLLKNLSRLGAGFPLEAIGLVGDDADGHAILADCAAHRIDPTQLCRANDVATSYTDVMTVRSTGRRTFFHQRGANAKLAPVHFDFTATNAKWFHLGYLLLLDTLDTLGADGRPAAVEVLARARAAGLLTSVDCVSESAGRFPAHVAPVLPEVDVLFVNDYEAEQLTGIALGRGATLDRGAVERAARSLITLGVRAWVVLHFPEGVCACSERGEIVWQASVRVPAASIGGTAGAGDALASGILLGLHEAWPMARALDLGVCVAAASLRSPTCSDSVVTAGECLATGRALGFHALPA